MTFTQITLITLVTYIDLGDKSQTCAQSRREQLSMPDACSRVISAIKAIRQLSMPDACSRVISAI